MTNSDFCVIEKASTSSLVAYAFGFISLEVAFVLIGGFVCPAPTFLQIQSNSFCVLKPPGTTHSSRPILAKDCSDQLDLYENVEDLTESLGVTWDSIVFTYEFPADQSKFYRPSMRFAEAIIEPILRPSSNFPLDSSANLSVSIAKSSSSKSKSTTTTTTQNTKQIPLKCSGDDLCDPQFLFRLNHLNSERFSVNIRIKDKNAKLAKLDSFNLIIVAQSPSYSRVWAILKTITFTASAFSFGYCLKNQPYNQAFDPRSLLLINTLANCPLDYLLEISGQNVFFLESVNLWLDSTNAAICVGLIAYLLKFLSAHGASLPNGIEKPLLIIALSTFSAVAFERFHQTKDPTHQSEFANSIRILLAIILVLYCLTLIFASAQVIQNLRSRVYITRFQMRIATYEGFVFRFYVWLSVSVGLAITLLVGFLLAHRNESQFQNSSTKFQGMSAFNLGLYGLANTYILALCLLFSKRKCSQKDETEMNEFADTSTLIELEHEQSVMDTLFKQSIE